MDRKSGSKTKTTQTAQKSTAKTTKTTAKSPRTGAKTTTKPTVKRTTRTKATATATQPKTRKPSAAARSAHKPWKIVLWVVAFVMLICCGVATWYLAYYNQPSKVAYDAVQRLLSSENVATDSLVMIQPKGRNSFRSAMLFLKTASSSLPTTLDATLAVTLDNERGFSADLDTTIAADGTVYVKLDRLREALQNLNLEDVFGDFVMEVAEEIEGDWWRVDMDEIAELFDLDTRVANYYNDIYGCVLQTMQRDQSGELMDLYKAHPFVNIERSDDPDANHHDLGFGYSLYQATFDYNYAADFINRLAETTAANEFYACYNNVVKGIHPSETISAADFDEISADDLREALPEDFRLYLEINDFTHELAAIDFRAKDGQLLGSMSFLYQNAVINLPQEYRALSELDERTRAIFYEELINSLGL